ncbi:hypothetical protein A946_01665 [Methylacidiphilum kamchatkense Kam1]|uniref:Uncharacterized protein n=1 Tax=Methylacidiphilum kamchatkense Kam1 TaxID=1202785 RepID=A0ABR4ZZ10_9BACT|nr:hypothetical protein A946_01665 [Methylacidiphilum kamchatkense Kam1]
MILRSDGSFSLQPKANLSVVSKRAPEEGFLTQRYSKQLSLKQLAQRKRKRNSRFSNALLDPYEWNFLRFL